MTADTVAQFTRVADDLVTRECKHVLFADLWIAAWWARGTTRGERPPAAACTRESGSGGNLKESLGTN